MEYIEADYQWMMNYCKEKFPNGFFEFRLGYGSRSEVYNEFNRFHWTSRHTGTRFKNKYDGPLVLDISEWADESPNTCLTDFLYYLADSFSPDACIIISEKTCSKELVDHIDKVLPIEKRICLLKEKNQAYRVIGFQAEGGDADRV